VPPVQRPEPPLVREIMEFAMPTAVPAKVDIKIGDDWSQV
jgi:hypothetical protein